MECINKKLSSEMIKRKKRRKVEKRKKSTANFYGVYRQKVEFRNEKEEERKKR